MKNIFWIFRRDLKRISGNFVAVIVILGMCIVPALYAWFNIAANMNPYENTSGIHIAVANCDAGTENESIGSLNAGESMIENLKENDTLGWVFTDEDKAVSGVRSGEYYAALIIPEDFSEDLVSVLSGEIQRPKIKYYLNEKKNAIAPKVTDTGATTIQQEVNATFVSVATEAVTELLEEAAKTLSTDISQINDGAVGELDAAAEKLKTAEENLKKHYRSEQENAQMTQKTYQTIDSAEEAAKSGAKTLRLTKDTLAEKLAQSLDDMQPAFAKMRTLMQQTENAANQASGMLETTSDTMESAREKLSGVQDDLTALKSATIYSHLLELADGSAIDNEAISEFVSSPVSVQTKTLYPVKNYGTAMTPFYTNLALWVSGIVLIALLKMEVDRDEKLKNMTATQGYFGRWLTFMLFACIQAVIICIGDLVIFDVQCENVPAFFGAALMASFVYVNLIYALAITFKHTGKALCVLLVILQIPGSAGTYPIEMTPGFFRALHPLLPFTYGINAMREAMAGMYENAYWKYLFALALFLPIAFLIGLGIRPLMLNLNRMFDKKLEETGLMICEENGMTRERLNLSSVLEILAGQEEFRDKMIQKAEQFEENYKKLKAAGILLILILPLIFLILMFSVSSKMVFLVLWIASIVAVVLYLIIIEFLHDSLERKLRFAEKSKDELITSMKGRA